MHTYFFVYMRSFLLSYIVLFGVLAVMLPTSVCFAEQWQTFYWDAAYCREVLQSNGGIWQLVTDFFTQFLATRWSAALMIGLLGALLAALFQPCLRPLFGKLSPKVPYYIKYVCPWLLSVAVAGVLCLSFVKESNQDNARFKAQMCLVEDMDWQAIIKQSEGRKVSNYLQQNMLNMALAETGQLQKRLMQQPCKDVNSLFVLKIESPYVAALLSDVYWTMGEISMSQMYAFEANEKMDNLSPRLLKRLALTNIVFGHYEVAAKYLNWLDKTLFYRQWSAQCRKYLSDEAVASHQLLSLKRACIPAENVFPSAQSVVYDLKNILKVNPGHAPSAEYLGALQMLYTIR